MLGRAGIEAVGRNPVRATHEAKDLESRLGPRLVELVRRIEAMLGL